MARGIFTSNKSQRILAITDIEARLSHLGVSECDVASGSNLSEFVGSAVHPEGLVSEGSGAFRCTDITQEDP